MQKTCEKKRFLQFFTVAAFCLLFFVLSFPVNAEPKKEDEPDKIIRIGYSDYAGFIEAVDGTYRGYGVEYLNEVAEYTGWKYEYVFDTWDNCLKRLETGDIDFMVNACYTDERAEKFLFSKYPTGLEEMVIYTKREDVPAWGKATVDKLINKGLMVGEGNGKINVEHNMLRTLVILDRAGVFDR